MKKLNNIFLFAVCILFTQPATAQKCAGYLGKHFMLGYSVNLGNNYFSGSNSVFNLHFRHGLHGEMIINRYATIGAEIDYLNDKIGSTRFFGLVHMDGGETRLISMSAGAYYKIYTGADVGLIAPIGNFIKYKLFAERLYIENKNNTDKQISKTYWSPGLGVSYGQSRILFNAARTEASIDMNMLGGVIIPPAVFAGAVITKQKNIKLPDHSMAYYQLLGYSVTVRLAASGLLF